MTLIIGTTGHDTLTGTSANDHIQGLGGDDDLTDGAGNDLVEGGDGNDRFMNSDGSDILHGGDGDDRFDILRNGQIDIVTLTGGLGHDFFDIHALGAADFVVDAGGGNDIIRMDAPRGDHVLTLGTGVDTVAVVRLPAPGSTIRITDFAVGGGGDRLDFSEFFPWNLPSWDGNQNPFAPAQGYARVRQSGADTILEIDADGGGNAYVEYVRLDNVSAAALTYHNLGGFSSNGSPIAPLNLIGTANADRIYGATGNDTLSGLGENDTIYGGSGADAIHGGDGHDMLHGEGGNDTIEGGAGSDQLFDGVGDDIVRGGADHDLFQSQEGGNDLLEGGGGDDNFIIRRGLGYHVTVDGGEGNDEVYVMAYTAANKFTMLGGSGNDTLNVMTMAGIAEVNLGAGLGADVISLANSDDALVQTGHLIVSEFDTGDGGDRLDFDNWLATYFTWDEVENPFASDHLLLVQDGSNVLLRADLDGVGGNWYTVMTFTDRLVAAFTPYNLDGFAADGSAPPGIPLLAGTPSGETLTGGAGADRIEGRGGLDTLSGMGGPDVLIGGNERDIIYGGSGNDRIEAGGGNDHIDGGAGDDEIYAGGGSDYVVVNQDADTVWGGAGNDEIAVQGSPSAGETTAIFGEAGADTIRLLVGMAGSTIVANGGADADTFEIGGQLGTTTVTLGGGSDRVLLTLGVYGSFQTGNVTITDFAAGAGGDFVDLPMALGALLLNWDGSDPFVSGHVRLVQQGGDTLLRIDVDGSGNGHGFITALTLSGVGAGALAVSNLGYEVSAVHGSVGDDTFVIDSAGDVVLETSGEGTDTVRTALGSTSGGAAGVYALPDNVEAFIATGNAQGVWGNALDNVITGTTGADLFVLADRTYPHAGANQGRDQINASGGDDYLFFGGSFDALDGITGGSGTDVIALLGNYPSLVLGASAWSGIERLAMYSSGNAADPYSYSVTTHDANVAAGQALFIGAGSLQANEHLTFNGSAETNGAFTVFAGSDADTLTGGAKADRLIGRGGADQLTGGLGNDVFQYNAITESNAASRDTILDFTLGDKIDLWYVDANSTTGANDAFSFIGNAAFTGAGAASAGQLRFQNVSGTTWEVQGDTDGNGIADFMLHVTVTDAHPLTAGDFIL